MKYLFVTIAVALAAVPALGLAGEPAPETITIDPGVTHQTIEGWGGNIYPATVAHAAKDPTLYDRAFKELKTTHMRVRSSWYLLESRNDNDDPATTDWKAIAGGDTGIVHDEFLMLQEMFKRKVKILFAAWRFPYWMCGKPADWKPKSGDRPGLPGSMEAEFVESLAAYLLYARKTYGVTYHALSIANEPGTGIYTRYDPGRLLRITTALKRRLADAKYDARFYCPDVTPGAMRAVRYAQRFFARKGAAELSCCVAYHSYRREVRALRSFRDLAAKLERPVWVAEQNYTHKAARDRFEWSHALKNAICLHDLLVESDAALSLHWSYVASSEKGLVLYNPKTKAWPPTYHMLKHFHNEVPVGSVRISAVPTRTVGRIRTLAFAAPGGKTLTVILINEQQKERSARVQIKGSRSRVLSIHRSGAARQYAEAEVPSGFERNGTLRIAGGSVVSLQLERGKSTE